MNILIGAISGNYKVGKIKTWVETSAYVREGYKRVLIIFNRQDNTELVQYCSANKIETIFPSYDFWGQPKEWFEHHTAKADLMSSYELIHNTIYLYINRYLDEFAKEEDRVIVTDVSDVKFNLSKFPFNFIKSNKLVGTSEMIKYKDHQWNYQHLIHNLGVLGLKIEEEEVLNVGVFGGPANLVKDLARDIYLMSVGKPKVADQTSFNFLARTTWKDRFNFSTLQDMFAVHCHVINEGHVKFDLNTLEQYSIIHQYDRLK